MRKMGTMSDIKHPQGAPRLFRGAEDSMLPKIKASPGEQRGETGVILLG